ncbi:hypothetical protein [Bradyrhizobium sp. AUGA SZCCT0182]|uniref:hypothetical protein n=1 Tax=Bradyrhizobium sp. AUGA SZCCT0182 TaxID=2807667 RepID=UPI002010D896|nr:hypothetical protein [Bradyrhizobium sp. AUGA SZCCT0182]
MSKSRTEAASIERLSALGAVYWCCLAECQNAGRPLSQLWIDWFATHGVPATALALSPEGDIDMLLMDCIEWHVDGETFDFAEGDANALTFRIRDRYGDVQDVAAWCPRTDRVATWAGHACMIGADQIDAMQPDAAGLLVCEGVLQWLQARRRGVVILDARRALPLLFDSPPLLAASLNHGTGLRNAFERALPPVLVPKESEAAI